MSSLGAGFSNPLLMKAKKHSISHVRGKKRSTNHVNQFIRIFVVFRDGKRLPLTVDRNQTIAYLARLIEAEHALHYVLDAALKEPDFLRDELDDDVDDDEDIAEKLFSVTQLYDSAHLPMSFSSSISELLCFGDEIFALGTDEESIVGSLAKVANPVPEAPETFIQTTTRYTSIERLADLQGVIEESNPAYQQLILGNGNQIEDLVPDECISPGSLSHIGSIISTTDDRVSTVLHNIIALQFFHEFCLNEFSVENVLLWIEIEIYKTIEDDDIRYLFGQYLYLLYLTPRGAPLKVNITDEARNEIHYPLAHPPSKDLFDEVQEHVYAMIKGHAYPRYVQSDIHKRCQEFINSDRYGYIQGRVTWTFGEWFEDDSKLTPLADVVTMLDMPGSSQSDEAIKKFNRGKRFSIQSTPFKQRLLSQIVARYFPLVSPVIKGYFSESNRAAWNDKQRRMYKVKLLSKFFGEAPSEEHLESQLALSGNERFSGVSASLNHDALGRTHSSGILSSSTISSFLLQPDPESDSARRRKLQKLTDFFGDRLSSAILRRQNILAGEVGDMNPIAEASAEGSQENMRRSIHEEDDDLGEDSFIGNTNILDPVSRKTLKKRAQKLQDVLGTPLDEKTVGTAVSQHLSKSKVASADELLVPGTPESLKVELDDYLLDSQEKTTKSGESYFSDDKDRRAAQRSRLAKLSQFLGHPISEDLIAQEISTTKSTGSPVRPLTSEEKKTFQKRANKLERVLGETIPADQIVHYGSVHSLIAPSDSMTNLATAETLASLNEVSSRNASTRQSMDFLGNPASLASEEDQKRARQTRLNKIRRKLGAEVSVNAVVEAQFLDELERDMHTIQDPVERSRLEAEINELRRTSREASNITTATIATGVSTSSTSPLS